MRAIISHRFSWPAVGKESTIMAISLLSMVSAFFRSLLACSISVSDGSEAGGGWVSIMNLGKMVVLWQCQGHRRTPRAAVSKPSHLAFANPDSTSN